MARRALTVPKRTLNWAHEVWQAVVSFPSANDAARFFGASVQRWPACSNRQYHYIDPDKPDDVVFTVGPIVKIGDHPEHHDSRGR